MLYSLDKFLNFELLNIVHPLHVVFNGCYPLYACKTWRASCILQFGYGSGYLSWSPLSNLKLSRSLKQLQKKLEIKHDIAPQCSITLVMLEQTFKLSMISNMNALDN